MSFDLNRIAAALKELGRSQRPYSIRDASPTDLMTDLGPFILAEVKQAIAEEREAYIVACEVMSEADAGSGLLSRQSSDAVTNFSVRLVEWVRGR
jgi:hypothetical protein